MCGDMAENGQQGVKSNRPQRRVDFLMAVVQTPTASSSVGLQTQAQRGDSGNPKGQPPELSFSFCDWKVCCWRVEQRWTELHSNTK